MIVLRFFPAELLGTDGLLLRQSEGGQGPFARLRLQTGTPCNLTEGYSDLAYSQPQHEAYQISHEPIFYDYFIPT